MCLCATEGWRRGTGHPGWQSLGVVESDGKKVTGPRSHIRMESNKWGSKCHRFPNVLLICEMHFKQVVSRKTFIDMLSCDCEVTVVIRAFMLDIWWPL